MVDEENGTNFNLRLPRTAVQLLYGRQVLLIWVIVKILRLVSGGCVFLLFMNLFLYLYICMYIVGVGEG